MPKWITPKTNWLSGDAVGYADLNRVEQNTSDMRDAIYRQVQGFGYSVDIGAAYIGVSAGSCFSEDYYPLKFGGGIKAFTAHALGFGTTVGGMAPGVTIAANTWYYIFALGKDADPDVEIMIDSSPTGANVTLANYPYKRFVNSFKTDASANACEMYSTGNDVFINPNAMFTSREITYTNTSGNDNTYNTVTLQSGAGNFALPARQVKAKLNCWSDDQLEEFGIISRVADASGTGLCFTIPAALQSGGVFYAEILGTLYTTNIAAVTDRLHADVDVIVNSSRQMELAMIGASGAWGELHVAVRGYTDTREL